MNRSEQKIAVIAWGSLVWERKQLLTAENSLWHPDGPLLPVEFADIPVSGKLTLVVHEESAPVRTYWNVLQTHSLEEAIENLREREECPDYGMIGALDLRMTPKGLLQQEIFSFLERSGCDAAVWTGVPSRFAERAGFEFSAGSAVKYLESLHAHEPRVFVEALDYFAKTPPQTETVVRKLVRKRFGVVDEGAGFWAGFVGV